MRPMTIAAGTITGVAGAFYLGYRKNSEEAEIERQLLLRIEQKVEKLAEKIDELKEKVVSVGDLLKQEGDLPKQVGDLPEKKGGDLEDV